MIRIRTAFALRLINDFTGRTILGERFLFSINGRTVHPVEKLEGLYVFLEPQESKLRVQIEGSGYYPCSVTVEKQLLNPEEPIAEVRLYERPGHSFSEFCELLTGRLSQQDGRYPSEVYANRTKPTGLVFKECREIEGEHWIWFQGFTKENLLGKPYVLYHKKKAVFFILSEKRGINEYRVDLIEGDPKIIEAGAPMVRIYRSVTDSSGAYAIPVERGEESLIQEVMILHHTLPS